MGPGRRLRYLDGWRAGALLLALSISGCGSHEGGRLDVIGCGLCGHPPPNCLELLQTATTRQDSVAYAQLFTPDFTFVFWPVDVANQQTPAQWGLADELDSMGHMFHSDQVHSISLSFQLSDPAPAGDIWPDTWRVEMTEINLRLDTRTAEGTALAIEVTSGHSTFYLKEFPDQHPSPGTNLWKIYRWEDRGFSSAMVGRGPAQTQRAREKTWGSIKALFSGR
jgi:hypothetical protein